MTNNPIDLATGHPSPTLIPIPQLQNAATTVFSTPSIWHQALNYGADAGYLSLRQNLAQWLTDFYGHNSDDGTKHNDNYNSDGMPDFERICVTGGASQNLACILQVYTDPVYTKSIFVVEPAYFLSFRIFEDAGFDGKLKGVPEDQEGIDLGILEESLRREAVNMSLHEDDNMKSIKQQKAHRKLYRHVIYCVPTFSNPSGRIMTLSRRRELVRLARRYDALIIADDVYDFVYWPIKSSESAVAPTDTDAPSSIVSSSTSSLVSRPSTELKSILPRLVDVDRTLDGGPINEFGNCVSNGSFSKIVGPGCRVGWAEGTRDLIHGLSQVGSTRSGGAPSQLSSTFIDEMLQNGSITKHIQSTLIPAYARRLSKLSCAIEQYLSPIGVKLPSLSGLNMSFGGGFFIWLQPPPALNAKEIAAAALHQGLIVGEGTSSALPDGNARYSEYKDMLRLCFACAEEELFVEAVLILRRVIMEGLSRT
ncbi:pyridoxal phosphate-dependent transferase [Lipomyces kononenkoae]